MSSMKMRGWIGKAALVVALAGCAMEHGGGPVEALVHGDAGAADGAEGYAGGAYALRSAPDTLLPFAGARLCDATWTVADGEVEWNGCHECRGPWTNAIANDGFASVTSEGCAVVLIPEH
jgi:hypothetical protein